MESTSGKGAGLYLRLLSQVKPYKGIFSIAIIAMIITALGDASFAALLKPIMDSGFVDPNVDFINLIPILIIGITGIRAIADFSSSYTMSWIGRKIIYDLRQDVFHRMVRLPTAYFDNNTSATLLSKLIYDVEQASTAATDAFTLFVKDSFAAIALFGWMLYLDWKLTLVFILLAPIIALTVTYAAKKFRASSERIQDSIGGIAHVVKESIQGHRIVKTYGGQEYEKDVFNKANAQNRHQNMKKVAVASAVVPVTLIVVGLGLATVIYFAVSRPASDAISAGTFVSFLGAILMVMSPLKRLARVNEKIQTGIAAANTVYGLIDQKPERDDGSVEIPRAIGTVEFEHVNFSYDGHGPTLNNVSFKIEPGQSVALVGPSGSGKSTIASLVLRLYRATNGTIKVDGRDVNDYTLDSYRSNLAVVTQESILFDDSIKNNIIYGAGGIDDKRLEAAVNAAHVREFIDRLPNGLDTRIGEQGVRLSGGQRQRISIARALYKDAPILILDEATSSLDSVSERLVQSATDELVSSRTTLIIAHRLSTIKNSDLILTLKDGEIVESGTHNELVAQGGVYAGLYQSQALEQDS